jgi:sn-glycerol 3-phosphate transport system substrate-binding protein
MFYNKDAFKKAGLDPAKPPQTWPELMEAAKKIKAANAAPCAFTTAWPTWAQFEQFSAIHDVPLATKGNGMGGLDTELKINSPLHVKHVQALMDMQKEGTFKYGGRDAAGDALFPSGECAMIHASSGLRARIVREAKFEWGAAMLPYWPGTPNAPKNSIIGGASFWVMTSPSRKPEEYKAVAEFFRYISQPEVVAKWHTDTGFLPITLAGFDRVKTSGSTRRTRAPTCRISSSRGASPARTRGACGWATCRRSATSSRKSWRRPSRDSRVLSRRWTMPCSAGMSC